MKAEGTRKLLDFGLTKAFQHDASDPNMSASPTIAHGGGHLVIGTAAYVAPAQAKVRPSTIAPTSGGAVYETLTGRKASLG